MPDSTAPKSMDTTQKFRVLIEASIDDVWREITRTDRPIPAFFNSRMDAHRLAAGSKLAMRTPDGKYTGVVGEILEFSPVTRFVHTFQFTAYDDPSCTVAYDLEEVDGGTQFTLTITDLPLGTKTAKQMVQGGKMIVNTLKSVLENGKPPLGIRVLFGLFKVLAFTTPKKCRSENWPVGPSSDREQHRSAS